MPYKGSNATKIIVSLPRKEREALQSEAEKKGLKVSTLCAEVLKRHVRRRGKGKAKKAEASEED